MAQLAAAAPVVATAGLVALLLVACGDAPSDTRMGGAARTAHTPDGRAGATAVRVVVAKAGAVENRIEVPGRVQAVRTAQVRARVDGIVEQRVYAEGSDVAEGDVLFRIDPRELQAALRSAQAALSGASATAANAARDVERYRGLIAEQVISRQQFDAAEARLRTARAEVEQARAQLERARLSLGYSVVRAPISGRAGRAEVTEGALVSAAAGTLLTTIEQLDPVYVNFSQSSAELLSLRREIASGALRVPQLDRVDVTLFLEDGGRYPHEGHLDFLDLSIDQQTGTAAARAEVPNPDRALLPGQFVRARIDAGVRPGQFLVPQRAVQLGTDGAQQVYVVDDAGRAIPREVRTGALVRGSWVVRSGLEDGDRVIVDGVQKLQPGAAVRVLEEPPATAAAR